MNSVKNAVVLLVLSLLISACSSMMSKPTREAYAGPDNITTVEKAMLVGLWNGRSLNPIEGESAQFTVNYLANGQVVTLLDNAAQSSALGNMKFEVSGTWQVQGEQLVQQAGSVREVSGSKMGGLMAGLMNGMKKEMSGTANVYEATEQRVVLVSDDGQALELTRAAN
jgi:hypothetical protein